jgi:hypothetical protein
MVYLGVDLHGKHSVVAALADDGAVLFSRRVESRPEAFRRIFGELGAEPLSVSFEATYGWYWFADLLRDAGPRHGEPHGYRPNAIPQSVPNEKLSRTLQRSPRYTIRRRTPLRIRTDADGADDETQVCAQHHSQVAGASWSSKK